METIRIPSVHHDMFEAHFRDEYMLRSSLRVLELSEGQVTLREERRSPNGSEFIVCSLFLDVYSRPTVFTYFLLTSCYVLLNSISVCV